MIASQLQKILRKIWANCTRVISNTSLFWHWKEKILHASKVACISFMSALVNKFGIPVFLSCRRRICPRRRRSWSRNWCRSPGSGSSPHFRLQASQNPHPLQGFRSVFFYSQTVLKCKNEIKLLGYQSRVTDPYSFFRGIRFGSSILKWKRIQIWFRIRIQENIFPRRKSKKRTFDAYQYADPDPRPQKMQRSRSETLQSSGVYLVAKD